MNVQDAFNRLRKHWSSESPIDDVGAFDVIEQRLGQVLPADYKWLLMESNGGETLAPLARLRLYMLEELPDRLTDGEPPDVLEIGTNDSDGYAFDLAVNRDTTRYPIVKYPLGDVDRTDVQLVARDIADFLAAVSLGREP